MGRKKNNGCLKSLLRKHEARGPRWKSGRRKHWAGVASVSRKAPPPIRSCQFPKPPLKGAGRNRGQVERVDLQQAVGAAAGAVSLESGNCPPPRGKARTLDEFNSELPALVQQLASAFIISARFTDLRFQHGRNAASGERFYGKHLGSDHHGRRIEARPSLL